MGVGNKSMGGKSFIGGRSTFKSHLDQGSKFTEKKELD